MIDDNNEASSSCYMGLEVDTDFDFESELDAYETEFDAYQTEVDNKVWINELIRDIDLENL